MRHRIKQYDPLLNMHRHLQWALVIMTVMLAVSITAVVAWFEFV